MALRKGTLIEMVNHGTGWVRMDYRVPARGLVGFRTEFMTETRGTGMLHHVFDGWEPWHGELKTKRNGSMVADRRGVTTGYTLMSLQERGILLVGPGTEVYEGMVVGENARDEEMDVNPTKEKKQTNIRSATRRRGHPPHAPAAALAGAGPRVHLRRRVRRGDPEGGAAPQGHPRPGHPGPPAQPGPQGRRLTPASGRVTGRCSESADGLDTSNIWHSKGQRFPADSNYRRNRPPSPASIRVEATGSEGRARTSNIWLQRPAFCQLNYLGQRRPDPCPATRPQRYPPGRPVDLACPPGPCHGNPAMTPIGSRPDASPRRR